MTLRYDTIDDIEIVRHLVHNHDRARIEDVREVHVHLAISDREVGVRLVFVAVFEVVVENGARPAIDEDTVHTTIEIDAASLEVVAAADLSHLNHAVDQPVQFIVVDRPASRNILRLLRTFRCRRSPQQNQQNF